MNLGRQGRAWYFTYVLDSAGASSASFGVMTDVPSGAVRTFIGIEESGLWTPGVSFTSWTLCVAASREGQTILEQWIQYPLARLRCFVWELMGSDGLTGSKALKRVWGEEIRDYQKSRPKGAGGRKRRLLS